MNIIRGIIYITCIMVFLQSSEHMHLDLCNFHNHCPNITKYTINSIPSIIFIGRSK